MDIIEVIADSSGLDVNITALLSLAVAVTSLLQFYPLNIGILKMVVSLCYPVFHTAGLSTIDMKTGEDFYYCAEKVHYKITCIQMGQFYNLPISGEAGGMLTHRADIQNDAESILYLSSPTAGKPDSIRTAIKEFLKPNTTTPQTQIADKKQKG